MITTPLVNLCRASSAVREVLGESPVRIYPFGLAPKDVGRPYAVFQTIGGSAAMYLGDVPDYDNASLQIDVYDNELAGAIQAAKAIRGAIESNCYVTRYDEDGKDPATGLKRCGFDVDWIVIR